MASPERQPTRPDLRSWGAADFPSEDAFTLAVRQPLSAELAACVDALHGAAPARRLEDFGHDDFALGTWRGLLEQARRELDTGRGFVRLRGLPFEHWDVAAARLATWGIGLQFGEHVSQTIDGQRLCDVTDTTHGDPSARQYRTNRELSLHTDPVSDLIGLACYRPAQSGGESVLVGARRVREVMAAERPDLLDTLARGFLVHRFGEGLPEDGPCTRYRVPMLIERGGQVLCRYVRPTVIAAHREAGVALTAQELEALDVFDEICRRPANQARFRLRTGDLLLVNNLGVMHAREHFTDAPGGAAPRLLFRLWLQAPAGFRAVPAEMNYFNRGRCGIPVQAGREAVLDMRLLAQAGSRR